jgi:hypothetical protein
MSLISDENDVNSSHRPEPKDINEPEKRLALPDTGLKIIFLNIFVTLINLFLLLFVIINKTTYLFICLKPSSKIRKALFH